MLSVYVILNERQVVMRELEKLNEAYTYIRKFTDFTPDVCLVLGSGLGEVIQDVEIEKEFLYNEIPEFPVSTTPYHDGKLILGKLRGVKVLVFSGRVHLYEGYTPSEVVRPVRLAYLLGASKLVLTNSAGGINKDYQVGDIVLLCDHISSFVESPIKGDIRREFGTKNLFPDVSEVYNKKLLEIFENEGKKQGENIKKGVYIQTLGAQYETPAEIRFFATIGADLVGMSTAIEATAGVHAGMKVVALSTVTNMACGISKTALSHEEVKAVAGESAERLKNLILGAIEKIAKE